MSLQAALGYASQGIRVFPLCWIKQGRCSCGKPDCPSPGKHPLTNHGVHDATLDPKAIKSWWSLHPHANVGLPTDEWIVVDVDRRSGGMESFGRLQDEFGADRFETVTSKTGGKGLHLVFQKNGLEIKSSAGRLAPGIDIRTGPNAFIVVPPSNHLSGQKYQWSPDRTLGSFPIAPFPECLLPKLQQKPHATKTDLSQPILEGKRNSTLTRQAGILRNEGFEEAAILAALKGLNRACEPPLPGAELATIAASVSRYPPGRIHITSAAEQQRQQDQSAREKQRQAGFTIDCVIPAADLVKLDIPERTELIESVCFHPCLGMFSGWRGLGKTRLALAMSKAIAEGDQFLYWNIPEPRRVLLVDGELTAFDLKALVVEFCGQRPPKLFELLSSEFFYGHHHWPLVLNNRDHQDRFSKLTDELDKVDRRPHVLIFDNLSSLTSGLEENSNSEQDGLLRFFVRLRHQGFTVFLFHHSGKSGDQRGASRREDFLDFSVKLSPPLNLRPHETRFVWDFTKMRRKMPQPATFECELFNNPGGGLTWLTSLVEDHQKPIRTPVQVLLYVGREKPTTQRAIAEALNLSAGTISKSLNEARERGWLSGLAVTESGQRYLDGVYGRESI